MCGTALLQFVGGEEEQGVVQELLPGGLVQGAGPLQVLVPSLPCARRCRRPCDRIDWCQLQQPGAKRGQRVPALLCRQHRSCTRMPRRGAQQRGGHGGRGAAVANVQQELQQLVRQGRVLWVQL
jgi:hypothetical protein